MEQRDKRSKIFQAYPFISNEELGHLVATKQWERLEERMEERTMAGAVKSVLQRERLERFSTRFAERDILERVLLYMNIVDVGKLAPIAPPVAQILGDENFWRKKLQVDVPELFVSLEYDFGAGNISGLVLYDAIESFLKKQIEAKHMYLVLRYFAYKMRKEVVNTKQEDGRPFFGYHYYHIEFEPIHNCATHVTSNVVTHHLHKDYQVFKSVVPFADMFAQHERCHTEISSHANPWVNYIEWAVSYPFHWAPCNHRNYLDETDNPGLFFSNFLLLMHARVLGDKYTGLPWKYGEPRFVFENIDANMFHMMLRGYAARTEEGVILVE